ncbi:TPA: DUF6625 family protein [Enterobacter chuandaensis]
MNNIALIVVYFGSFPNYFKLWAKSAKKNNSIDFYIITDQVEYDQQDGNLYYIKKEFAQFKSQTQRHFDFKISLSKPYKICDFKPLYGIIFSDILLKYDFWGHIDIDVILGNIRHFVSDKTLLTCKKIYSHGHLTLYRNTPTVNHLYLKSSDAKMLSYKDVFQTDYICHFDESEGMTYLCNTLGIETYHNTNDFADINYKSYAFKRAQENSNKQYIYYWDDGCLFEYCYDKKSTSLEKRECAYIHLQKRSMHTPAQTIENAPGFFIVPNYFLAQPFTTKNLNYNYNRYARKNKFYLDYYLRRLKDIKQKFLNGYVNYKISWLLSKL